MLKKICSVVLAIAMLLSMTTAAFGNIYFIDNFSEDNFSAKKILLVDNYALVAGGVESDATDVLNIYDLATRKLVTSLALPIYETGRDYYVENMYSVGGYVYVSWNKNKGWGDPPIHKYELAAMLKGELNYVNSVGVRGDHVTCNYDNKIFFTDPVYKTLSIINADTNTKNVVMNFDTVSSIADFIGVCADSNYFYIARENEILAYPTTEVYNGYMQDYDSPYAVYDSDAKINSVSLNGGNIYVADESGLTILTIADGAFSKAGAYVAGGEVMAVEFAGNNAYIYADKTKSIDILSVADITNPAIIDSVEVNNPQTMGITDLAVNNGKIYAADLTEGFSFYSTNELDRMEAEDEFKAETYEEEIELSRNGYAIELIVGLGIMDLRENGLFSPNLYMTRGEFADAVSNLLGSIKDDHYANGKFTDVPADHPNAAGIYALANLGIINGVGDGKFLPDDPIMYEHAVTIMLKLLGYYPIKNPSDTVMGLATKLRILGNVASMSGGYISRGDVAMLIYNSLEKERLDVAYYQGSNITYGVSENNTLLAQMGINISKGQITATEFTSLLGNKRAGEDSVIINGLNYPEGKSGASSLLGRYVTFYHKCDGERENGEILFIKPYQSEDVITINAKDISPATTTTVFRYYDKNHKTKEESIRNATVIFNGKYFAGYTASDLVPSDGEVTLIDNGNDGSVDVVLVRSYETFIVDGFSTNIFKFKYGYGTLNIKNKLSTADKIVIEVDGMRYDTDEKITGIKEWSVASVVRSRDEKIIEVYVTNKIVPGVVTSKATDGDDEIVAIDDVEYVVSDYYKELLNGGKVPPIVLGDEVFTYVDMFGKIATISVNELSAQYGYLIDCEGGIGPNARIAEFRILVRDQNEIHGSVQYFAASDKLKINGTKVTSYRNFPEELKNGESVKDQLVKFTLNNEGEIKELFTATNKADEKINGVNNPDYELDYIGYTEDEFTYDKKITSSTAFRGGDMKTFEGHKYLATLDTQIFVVPKVVDSDNKAYKVYDSVEMFTNGKTHIADLELYDVNVDYNIGAIVIKSGNYDEVGNNGTLAVVDSFVGGVDENGDEKTILVTAPDATGYQKRVYLENPYITDKVGKCNIIYKGKKLIDLPKGSVIQYTANLKGEIEGVRILFIPNDVKEYFEYGDPRVTETYIGVTFYTSFAKVIKVTSEGRVIFNGHSYEAANATTGAPEWYWDGQVSTAKRNWDRNLGAVTKTPPIYLYDKADDTISIITLGEILPDDDMFIVMKAANTNMIVIYR